MFSSRLDVTVLTQSATLSGKGSSSPALTGAAALRSAVTHEPMSPTTGAAISTFESISFGSMSTWMNFFGSVPQALPLPCERSQLSRAPISITTSDCASTVERAAPAHWGCVSGNSQSEEHTSELQSRGLISYAVFCLKKQQQNNQHQQNTTKNHNTTKKQKKTHQTPIFAIKGMNKPKSTKNPITQDQ